MKSKLVWLRQPVWLALAVLLLLSLSQKALALEPVFKYITTDSISIQSKIIISDSFPSELIGYINKGVPILVQYRLELWRERSGWFDKLVSESQIIYKIRFDSWDKEYAVVEDRGDLVIENTFRGEREALELLSSSGGDNLPIDDNEGVFYLVGRLTIKTMSFSNYKEVESWLKGGISNAKKPELEDAPSKVSEFVFNMALRVSGLKDISREIQSTSFKIGDLPLLHK